MLCPGGVLGLLIVKLKNLKKASMLVGGFEVVRCVEVTSFAGMNLRLVVLRKTGELN